MLVTPNVLVDTLSVICIVQYLLCNQLYQLVLVFMHLNFIEKRRQKKVKCRLIHQSCVGVRSRSRHEYKQ